MDDERCATNETATARPFRIAAVAGNHGQAGSDTIDDADTSKPAAGDDSLAVRRCGAYCPA
jgi:hypothetical protein